MTTPGAIKRYLGGAWVREGGYTIYVPTVGGLPAAPDDDGVVAYVASADTYYHSRSGVWVQGVGAGAPGEWYGGRITTATGLAAAKTYLTPSAGTGSSSNVTVSGTRVTVATAGVYHVTLSLMMTATAGTNTAFGIEQYTSGGTLVIAANHNASSTNWNQTSLQQDFNCSAGDYFQFYVTPDASGRGVDNRSAFSVSQVAAQGPQGPPGSGVPIVANVAALPTGVAVGYNVVTADTGITWVWRSGGYWTPPPGSVIETGSGSVAPAQYTTTGLRDLIWFYPLGSKQGSNPNAAGAPYPMLLTVNGYGAHGFASAAGASAGFDVYFYVSGSAAARYSQSAPVSGKYVTTPIAATLGVPIGADTTVKLRVSIDTLGGTNCYAAGAANYSLLVL